MKSSRGTSPPRKTSTRTKSSVSNAARADPSRARRTAKKRRSASSIVIVCLAILTPSSTVFNPAIHRERNRPAEGEGDQRGDVEQVHLEPHRSENRSRRRDALEPDRGEPVARVDAEHRRQHDD